MAERDHYRIHVTGTVQGVGFRPFVYRLAKRLQLAGQVENREDGVWIDLLCDQHRVNELADLLISESPPAAHIDNILINKENNRTVFEGFTIRRSRNQSDRITGISPDIAVCEDCLRDMLHQSTRLNYPFINCTNCGPRFSIIQDLPYDRSRTSMNQFPVCHNCEEEYCEITDRRFHAQPVACWDCGPRYYCGEERSLSLEWKEVLQTMSGLLVGGKTIAVQGIGGYHLICDAINTDAVELLRLKKRRDRKPFAVMFRDLITLRTHCLVDQEEEKQVTGWRRPIVLLREIKALSFPVNFDLGTIGAILPYTPLHHQLFQHTHLKALVCTSGNISDEPIAILPEEADQRLGPLCELVVHSNRLIINRTDDSVIRIAGGHQIMVRRSRGYVPGAIPVGMAADGILALGSELKSTFCIAKGRSAILSQHIGDLQNQETYDFYASSIERFMKLFRFQPDKLVCDLHPDYLSTHYAASLELPVELVQHHHAHITSCMAEHLLDEPVIGVAFDGIGLGTDGLMRGSEFMVAELDRFENITSFQPVPMPGGDLASKQPWRMALSYLHQSGMEPDEWPLIDGIREAGGNMVTAVWKMLANQVDMPLTTGAGRLFDAVASLLGCCHINGFEAEAPIRLESWVDPSEGDHYPFAYESTISMSPMLVEMKEDLSKGTSLSCISSKFHNTLVRIILHTCQEIRNQTDIKKVVLSGGTFQNAFLLVQSIKKLESQGFQVYTPQQIPANDGGISLGQLITAAKRNTTGYVFEYSRPNSIHR